MEEYIFLKDWNNQKHRNVTFTKIDFEKKNQLKYSASLLFLEMFELIWESD